MAPGVVLQAPEAEVPGMPMKSSVQVPPSAPPVPGELPSREKPALPYT